MISVNRSITIQDTWKKKKRIKQKKQIRKRKAKMRIRQKRNKESKT